MSPAWLEAGWKLAAVIFAAGAVWGELKAIRKDIARLEKKQEESNRVKERLASVEVDIAKAMSKAEAANKRITELHYEHRRL